MIRLCNNLDAQWQSVWLGIWMVASSRLAKEQPFSNTLDIGKPLTVKASTEKKIWNYFSNRIELIIEEIRWQETNHCLWMAKVYFITCGHGSYLSNVARTIWTEFPIHLRPTHPQILIWNFRENVDRQFVCLFDLILYVPSPIFQLNRDRSSWVEPVLLS